MTTFQKLESLVEENFDYTREGDALIVEYDRWTVKYENHRGQVIMSTYFDNMIDGIQCYFDGYDAYSQLFNIFYDEEI